MKKLFFVGLFLTIVLNGIAQNKYECPSGYFKATFPAAVTDETSDMGSSSAANTMNTFMAIDEQGGVFMVSYVDYPDEYFADNTEISTFLESSATGFFEELDIIPQHRKEVKSKKYKGLEYRGQNSEYGVIYRVFIAKNLVFQLVALGNNSYPNVKSSTKLFKSFKITL